MGRMISVGLPPMANGTFDELVGGGGGEMAVIQCLGCGKWINCG